MVQVTAAPGGFSGRLGKVNRQHQENSEASGAALCSLLLLGLVQSPPPALQIHTPKPQVAGAEHQAFEVLLKVLRQDAAQEPRTNKPPREVCASPLPAPLLRPPLTGLPCPQGRAVLTSRKRFQYLSRSYCETVLSHWSLSRKLPLLGPAPPASASRCRLSTWRKHHAAAAAASTAIAGICGAVGRGRAGR